LCAGWKVSERASAPPIRRVLSAQWRGLRRKGREGAERVFGRVEAHDSVSAAMDQIDLDRSYG